MISAVLFFIIRVLDKLLPHFFFVFVAYWILITVIIIFVGFRLFFSFFRLFLWFFLFLLFVFFVWAHRVIKSHISILIIVISKIFFVDFLPFVANLDLLYRFVFIIWKIFTWFIRVKHFIKFFWVVAFVLINKQIFWVFRIF